MKRPLRPTQCPLCATELTKHEGSRLRRRLTKRLAWARHQGILAHFQRVRRENWTIDKATHLA